MGVGREHCDASAFRYTQRMQGAAESQTTVQKFGVRETALRIDPYEYWAHFRMARALETNKDTQGAMKQYEFLLRYAFDRDPDIYIKLATLYRDAGRKADAIRVLKKGRRILSTNRAIYRLYREVLGVG